MKRIVMKLTVALVITAMMVAMAMPAFAQGRGKVLKE
jgi:Tfp pilus assembly protein FimT